MLLPAAYARLQQGQGGAWAALGLRTFLFVLQRGDVQLEAQVDVTLEYPLRPPELRLVKMQWPAEESSKKGGAAVSLPKSELATFEAEMNVRTAKLLASDAVSAAPGLLAWQVAALMAAFDVYADQALTQRSICSSGSAQAPPPETRGRDLRRPAPI